MLLVLEITVSELNSSTDGVAANAVDASGNVRKAGGAIRLRDRLLADGAAVGSGCASAPYMRRLVVVTDVGGVLPQIFDRVSQIIEEWASPRDLLRVTRRRHELGIRGFCSTAQDHDH